MWFPTMPSRAERVQRLREVGTVLMAGMCCVYLI